MKIILSITTIFIISSVNAHETSVHCMDAGPNLDSPLTVSNVDSYVKHKQKQTQLHPLAQGKLEVVSNVTSLAELTNRIKKNSKNSKKTFVFLSADWDANGKLLANSVLRHPDVAKELKNFSRLNVNATKNDDKDLEFYKHFRAIGPPVLAIYDEKGKMSSSIIGKCIEPKELIEWLQNKI